MAILDETLQKIVGEFRSKLAFSLNEASGASDEGNLHWVRFEGLGADGAWLTFGVNHRLRSRP